MAKLHVMDLRLFQNTRTDLVRGHGMCKGNLHPSIIFFHIQSNHRKYTVVLISDAYLPELYILINSGIKVGKTPFFRNNQKMKLFDM